MTKTIAKAFTCLVITGISGFSQTPAGLRSTGLEETNNSHQMEAARPLIGYATDGSNLLRAVVGTGTSPQWGTPILVPSSTSAAFLPPRQEYVLLAGDELSVARLSRSTAYTGTAIPNTMGHPDQVVFSPSGDAAVLVSFGEKQIQIVTLAGAKPALQQTLPMADPSEHICFAISDDGKMIVINVPHKAPMFSWQGGNWKTLPVNYKPNAWTFLPHSHNLIISDPSKKAIVLIPEAEQPLIAEKLVADRQLAANLLLPNKSGTCLLAVAIGDSKAWTIDLSNGAVSSIPSTGPIDSLELMRDGQSFLIGSKDRPIVVRPAGLTQTAPQIDSY